MYISGLAEKEVKNRLTSKPRVDSRQSSQYYLQIERPNRGGHWDFWFCSFGYFLDSFFFGFCAKRIRFFGSGVPCGLRNFRF